MRKTGTYERRIIYPELIKSKTVWRIASGHQKKVGVINMPMTTPQEIKAFMLPDFLHKDEGVIIPTGSAKENPEKIGYRTNPRRRGNRSTQVSQTRSR